MIFIYYTIYYWRLVHSRTVLYWRFHHVGCTATNAKCALHQSWSVIKCEINREIFSHFTHASKQWPLTGGKLNGKCENNCRCRSCNCIYTADSWMISRWWQMTFTDNEAGVCAHNTNEVNVFIDCWLAVTNFQSHSFQILGTNASSLFTWILTIAFFLVRHPIVEAVMIFL